MASRTAGVLCRVRADAPTPERSTAVAADDVSLGSGAARAAAVIACRLLSSIWGVAFPDAGADEASARGAGAAGPRRG
jgi:hypothetical protein